MKRRCCFVLIWLVALSRTSGTPVQSPYFFSQANLQKQSENASGSWARENYNRVLDLVLQDRCTESKDARWITCIRIVPGHPAELEHSLSVERRYDGTVLAHIVRPKAQSIYTQICRRKEEHPQASIGDLAKLIELESEGGNQSKFPGLAGLADQFEKIQLSPALADEIIMDATEYRFRIKSFSGEQMELTLHGPGSGAPHQSQALIRWAESGKQMLARAFHVRQPSSALISALPMLSVSSAAQEKPAAGSKMELPKAVSASVPFYPSLARETHIEGNVTLRVSTDGKRVGTVDAENGHRLLVKAATENVKAWQFEQHAPTTFEVKFHYRLLKSKCDSECNCESEEKESVVMQLPANVEVTATALMTCDPAVEIRHKK